MLNKLDKIIIKNGIIFDPFNNIKGEKKDILIEKGKIVEKFSTNSDIKEIDANNKTVIPSAIDIHTHVASQQINWVRLLGTNNKTFMSKWKGLTLDYIARNYISHGYTFIIEANVYPSLAKQTLFNFINLPVLDKGMLLNVSNFWPLELEFEKGNINNISYFLSDLLSKCKGFGIKAYNPFEAEMWNFNSIRANIHEKGRLYNFSALDVYKQLIRGVESLNLPHSIQCHIEGYEQIEGKENLSIILDELIKNFPIRESNSKLEREQIIHLAHANSYNIDGDNTKLVNLINNSNRIDIDLGFIGFNKINPIITSDRRFINNFKSTKDNFSNIINNSCESEGDSFVSFRQFNKSKYHDCILWSNSIDLALKVKNKWQIQFSLNFPHYSHIDKIPEITTWLLSVEARRKFMLDMNKEFLTTSSLLNNDEILGFYDYVIITRASPAKSLGVAKYKGSFTPGLDADLNILDLNLNEIDTEKDYEIVRKSLENIEFVLKNGEIVKKDKNIILNNKGLIFWTEGKSIPEEKIKIMAKKKQFYQKYYSYFYEMLDSRVNSKYLKKLD